MFPLNIKDHDMDKRNEEKFIVLTCKNRKIFSIINTSPSKTPEYDNKVQDQFIRLDQIRLDQICIYMFFRLSTCSLDYLHVLQIRLDQIRLDQIIFVSTCSLLTSVAEDPSGATVCTTQWNKIQSCYTSVKIFGPKIKYHCVSLCQY